MPFLKKVNDAVINELENPEVDVLQIDVVKLVKSIFNENSVYQEFIDDIKDIRDRYEISEMQLINALSETLKSQDIDFQEPTTEEGEG